MTTKITFDKDGNETIASVQRRVAELTGFQYKRIVLMEGNLTGGVYDSISFQVNGRGYSTDFEDFDRNPVFDEPRPYEVN